MRSKVLYIRVPEDIDQAIKQVAEDRNVFPTTLVNAALLCYLEEKCGYTRPAGVGVP
jgi:hypothetical protein